MNTKRAKEIEQLIKRNKGLVYTVARRSFSDWLPDQDLMQCGMIGLWQAAKRWDHTRSFRYFAMPCIHNAICNYLRQELRWKPLSAPLPPPPPSPRSIEDAIIEEMDLNARICAAFPPNSRERYLLTALSSGVSIQAAAVALSLDVSRARRLARRAYEKIKPEEIDHE